MKKVKNKLLKLYGTYSLDIIYTWTYELQTRRTTMYERELKQKSMEIFQGSY